MPIPSSYWGTTGQRGCTCPPRSLNVAGRRGCCCRSVARRGRGDPRRGPRPRMRLTDAQGKEAQGPPRSQRMPAWLADDNRPPSKRKEGPGAAAAQGTAKESDADQVDEGEEPGSAERCRRAAQHPRGTRTLPGNSLTRPRDPPAARARGRTQQKMSRRPRRRAASTGVCRGTASTRHGAQSWASRCAPLSQRPAEMRLRPLFIGGMRSGALDLSHEPAGEGVLPGGPPSRGAGCHDARPQADRP